MHETAGRTAAALLLALRITLGAGEHTSATQFFER
jgi:hypothetical protein